MSEKKEEKKNFLTSLFKKDKGIVDETPTEPSRRRLQTQLSASEKSKRRSTIGPSTGLQMSLAVNGGAPAATSSAGAQPAVPKQPAPVEVDTQFSKMLKSSPNMSGNKDTKLPDSGAKSKKSGLSSEEKKARRLSLLAPVEKIFAPKEKDSSSASSSTAGSSTLKSSGDSISKRDIAPDLLKARRTTTTSLFKKDNFSDLSFNKRGVNQPGGADNKLMKQKQKQLQKQMDKEEKKASKEEKRKQEKALEILQAQLELGRDRAVMPEPQPQFVAMPAVRPARMLSMK